MPAGSSPGRVFDHADGFRSGRATSVVLIAGLLVNLCALVLLILRSW